ncbi:septation protein A [Limnohabitans sp. JirII-29]|jgi:intracellular septation protein|uniref:septation protein A n=1 Tax=unclassified Limnohabitans TaxID=2626134 RepID=UPI000C1F6A95|nr:MULTISPECIES: septation protein A [unclassified Limnohabitans]PIT80934.1 septation protein A [Limnohabitans sp. JirII-31]PUE28280.1 septation protein A [Limnohabitans sp. JirII-29]
MKIFFDFFPIILFFAVFKTWGIYAATSVAIVATIGQIAWLWRKNGFVEPMQWVSLGVIVVFGGATLITQDETFIKWKPTVLYWLMGGALWVGHLVFKRNLLRQLMSAQLTLPDHAWRVLLHSWAVFFTGMGFLNLWVANHFDTDTWVSFKLFGGLGLMLVFVLVQGFYLSRFMQEDKEQA